MTPQNPFSTEVGVKINQLDKTPLKKQAKEVIVQRSLYSLYKRVVGEYDKVNPTFLTVQKQPDGFNCGVFAIAFAAEILDGCSPMDAGFDVGRMRKHLMTCL